MEIVGFVVLGLVAGALAATLGIGGGVVIVPVLVSVFLFTQHQAQGTSLAVIVPTVLVAAITHARAGRILWRLMAWVGIAGIIGAVGGARLALRLDDAILRRFFAVVLIFIAIRMALRARSLFGTSRPINGG
ncbi:MAG: sulfite exporter TauE/SafE family protein [Acidimicrobiia bacterium]|nr:sulfite exporter TauE/SafE family protein [Acidimicrobiia bacterium]